MIEIRYLQAESGANKFGTCNCCGKSSGEDPLMISVKFNYCGHGMTICLCDDCKKKLMEALPPANNSEIPNSSDTISRADVEQTIEDNILCYTHSDRPIDQDPDTECHMAIRTALRMLRKDLRKLTPAQPEIITCDRCVATKRGECIWHNAGATYCSFGEVTE